ncbi:sensor histidine kinase [Nocardioides ferulae]|uniref:sensor histidine kinase n=1 Tax=Nocardioides ferulae TaxID=2340821 RepID=UPI0013DE0EAB|nr:sensor histidine kinase [Nocardioides ferulae]
MRALRNPVVQFLLIGVVTLIALVITANRLAEHAAEQEALAEAQATNEVLARSVARPDIPASLLQLDVGAADQFLRLVTPRLRLKEPEVTRLLLWRDDGTVIYSFPYDLDVYGQQFGFTDVQEEVLRGRDPESRTAFEYVDPALALNSDVPSDEEWVRIYTRTRIPSGELILFEADYSLSEIEQRREEIYASFRWIVLGGPFLLLLLVTPLLHILTRRLTKAGEERERLLRSAIDASDAERRRIARDLHDGVVQDLAGTAYSVTALARSPQTSPDARTMLDSASESLRGSLSALRSLLAEIHPPDLHANGLGSALADLIAPAEREGVQASVSVAGVEAADDAAVALVWRVAQEAVRNALRHAQASTLAVTVRVNDGTLCLEVVDDGVGFDPAEPPPAERYGLRGMRTLVADVGGRLEVESAPGDGTAVRVEVDLQ